MPRKASSKSDSGSPSTATIGFEATALRGSISLKSKATLRSLSAARDNQWLTADKLRNNMDAAETSGANRSEAEIASQIPRKKYRGKSRASVTRRASAGPRVKYISDTFEEHRAKLLAGSIRVPRVGSGVPADPLGQYGRANAEDPGEA